MSVITNELEREPSAVGVKTTEMVQVPPGAIVVPQLPPLGEVLKAKSPVLPPDLAIDVIVRLEPPVFVQVVEIAGLKWVLRG